MASKARKSKFFRVAVEGATTDGRKIERKWLTDIAKNYSQLKYGARIFIEHIRGLNPEWGFRCMGDVTAVKTDTVTIDGQEKLALFAQIEPTDEMIKLNKAGQKIYSSIEVDPDFAGSGDAYLVGLGITDTPASLGTEILAFAAQHPDASPFAARKQKPGNVFSAAEPAEIELEDEPAADGPSVMERVRGLFKSRDVAAGGRFSDIEQAVEHVAQAAADNAEQVSKLTQGFADLSAKLEKSITEHQKAVARLVEKIDHTPAPGAQRPAATGGSGAVVTDC